MLSKAFVDSCKSFSLKTCLGHIQPDDFPVPKLLMCLAAMRSKHIGITLRSFKSDLMNQFITVQLGAHTARLAMDTFSGFSTWSWAGSSASDAFDPR